MATTFFLWPSSSSQEKQDEATSLTDPSFSDPDPTISQISKPKPRKNSKRSAPKKLPQRGLGVAQLERLRLQDRWKRISETDQLPPIQPIQFYDHTIGLPLARFAAPIAYGESPPSSPGFCYLQRFRLGNPEFVGNGGVSGVRSAFSDQYSFDRRFQVGIPFPELSSNQKLQCLSDQCEFCAKKRLYGENLGFNGSHDSFHYSGMDFGNSMTIDEEMEFVGFPKKKGKSVGDMKLKEYEFFPPNEDTSNGDSSFADRTIGDASTSAVSDFLDLSLKLSC